MQNTRAVQAAALRLLLWLLCGAAAATTTPAGAQSVDYGALEQLFGEPVTTGVTGKPQRATDAPANIEIITQDDIRRSGATTIPDVLQFVAGVDVRREGLGSTDVGIRGYNQASNPHLMVLVNGRQVYMVDYGRIVWDALPVQLDEIRQIEVIKGPNSALYGFNAVGGVINIITYDPLHDNVNVATVRGGTQDYLDGSVVGTGHIGDSAGVRLSAGGFRADDFAPGPLTGDDRYARQSPYSGNFNGDMRWQITPSVEAFADASYGHNRLADQEPPGVFGTEQFVTSSIRAGVNADTRFGVVSLSAYRSDARVGIDNVNDGVPIDVGEYQSSYVVQGSDLVKLGADHTLRFGLEYRADADDSGDLAGGRISNSIYAASLMWDWQVTPAVTVTNAIRVDDMKLHYAGTLLPGTGLTTADYNRVSLVEPSTNSGIVWKATEADTFRLTIARGVQLPTLLQYGLQIPPGFYAPPAFVGNPDLHPSIVWNEELDYDRSLAAIRSTLRTAVFLQRTDDVIAWPFGAPFSFAPSGLPVFFSANVGYSTAAGAEIGIKGHNSAGFHWNASYSFVSTTDHTVLNQTPPPTSIVEYGNSTPRNVVIGGIGYARDKWELDVQARWQSSYLDFRMNPQRTYLLPIEIDNYLTATARVGYRVTDRVTLGLTAQQFNQSQLLETAGPPVERRIIGSVSVRM
ncbi:MAG TPA: TonB-dependent receptor plug domain-containing protein [Acetobacteraceae bacterium]